MLEPSDYEIVWRTFSWRKRKYVDCRECGHWFELQADSGCPRCSTFPILEALEPEPRKRWYVAVARAPFLAKTESGESLVMFKTEPKHRILIPREIAEQVNEHTPGALEDYRKKNHGPLDKIPVGHPGCMRTTAVWRHKQQADLEGPHIWRTWFPRLISEVVKLRADGILPEVVQLPPCRIIHCPDCQRVPLEDHECRLVERAPNLLEKHLSQDGRWMLHEWCERHQYWGEPIRLPDSSTDQHNAYVLDILVKELHKERGQFSTDKAFIAHVIQKWRPMLRTCGLPAGPTQLRAALIRLGVLNPRKPRK